MTEEGLLRDRKGHSTDAALLDVLDSVYTEAENYTSSPFFLHAFTAQIDKPELILTIAPSASLNLL